MFTGEAIGADFCHDEYPGGNFAPDAVVEAQSTDDVSVVLKICSENDVPVTVRGAGTGQVGGSVPIKGGIVLSVKGMDKILEFNEAERTLRVQPGVLLQDVKSEAESHGLYYPPDPGEKTSTIGGNAATDAGGPCAVKYGGTRDYIVDGVAVLADGSVKKLNDAEEIIGSEGTLGVMTKVTLKIHPIPEARKFHAFLFPDMHSAMTAGAGLMHSRLQPCAIRLYDGPETARLIRRVLGIDREGAYLVFGFDGPEKIVDLQMERACEICRAAGPKEDLGSESGEAWWRNRYKFFYPPYMFHMPQAFGTLDTVATFSRIENVYWAMKETVEENFPEATFIGHFSHWYDWGCMNYSRFIIDNPPEDQEECIRLHNRIWNAGVRAAIANGGVINDHHGIGLKLSRLMKEQYGPAMQVMESLKKGLDPNGIMNPYKLGL